MKTKAWLGIAISISVVASLILTACAPGAPPVAPPVVPLVAKPESVKIGRISAEVGPAAATAIPMGVANSVYVQYVNEELGGIDGVRLELLTEECEYDVAKGIDAYKRLKSKGIVVVQSDISGVNEAIKEMLAVDRIPMVAFSLSTHSAYPPGWIFLNQTIYANRWGFFLNWFKDNWKQDRKPVLGYLTWDNGLGRSCLGPECIDYANKLGFDTTPPVQFIPIMPTDVVTQLKALEKAGVDLVCSGIAAPQQSVVMKDTQRLGLTEKMTFFNWTMGFSVVTDKLSGGAAEGIYGVEQFGLIGEDVPGIKLMESLYQKYAPEKELISDSVWAWTNTAIQVEAITRAVKKVGWDKLDGTAVYEALLGMKDVQIKGMEGLLPPISYSPTSRFGNTQGRICQLKGGEIVALTDWVKQLPTIPPPGFE